MDVAANRSPGWRWAAEFRAAKFGTKREKLLFWKASQRFKKIITGVGSPGIDFMDIDFRDVRDFYATIPLRDLIRGGGAYDGIETASLDLPTWDENDSGDGGSHNSSHEQIFTVDGGQWNPYRDLDPHALRLHNQDVRSLLSRELGEDYEILARVICNDVPRAELGRRVLGYLDQATASAAGTGIVAGALRRLVAVFERLDRLESGEMSVRECRQTIMWTEAGRSLIIPKRSGWYHWYFGRCWVSTPSDDDGS